MPASCPKKWRQFQLLCKQMFRALKPQCSTVKGSIFTRVYNSESVCGISPVRLIAMVLKFTVPMNGESHSHTTFHYTFTLTIGVLSTHWPLVIGRSKRSANSCLVPRRFGLTKSTIHQYSVRLFWRGYPVITIRLLQWVETWAWSTHYACQIGI